MKQRIAQILKAVAFAALNVWLVFHVMAVFLSPAGMPPASPLLMDVSRAAQPYNQLMFLNHGYHYFAPDPGASTLISYTIERPGDTPLRGRFPTTDLSPRLLYHRYFMLAENVAAFPEDTQQQVLKAYARHFAAMHDADHISLYRVTHEPSSIARIQAGGRLDDPETYFEDLIGHYDFTSDHKPGADLSLNN